MCMGNSRCAKRSWRQACQRALRDGHAFYRGRSLLRVRVLSCIQHSRSDVTFAPEGLTSRRRSALNQFQNSSAFSTRDRQQNRQGTRIGQQRRQPWFKLCSWNVGGLGIGQLDSFLNYFWHLGAQVATLQEQDGDMTQSGVLGRSCLFTRQVVLRTNSVEF